MPLKLHEHFFLYKHNKTKCVATPSRKRSASRDNHTIVQKTVYFVGTELRRAKSVLTTITIVVLEHLHLWTKY